MLICASAVRARTSAITHATARPIATPPAASRKNFSVASPSEKLPPTTAATATR